MSASAIGKFGLGAAGATAVAMLVAGCGSSSNSVKPAAAAGSTGSTSSQSQPSAAGSASGLQSKSTSIGTVLVDTSGKTVYELVGDTAANPNCTGACLSIWPAVTANGAQVVVNGHPAFTFVGDKSAGQTTGQNVKDQWGTWLALDASGNPISASASTPSSPAPATSSKAPNGGGAAF